MSYSASLFADYHQIHIFDDGSTTSLGDAWLTETATATNLAVEADAIAVGTTVNVFVDVTVDILDRDPGDDSADFDHVAEASLRSASGRLVVMGCTGYEPDADRIAVPAGWLRLRASRRNLDAAWEADLASDDDPDTTEQVRIQVWPADPAKTELIKLWQPTEHPSTHVS